MLQGMVVHKILYYSNGSLLFVSMLSQWLDSKTKNIIGQALKHRPIMYNNYNINLLMSNSYYIKFLNPVSREIIGDSKCM